MSGSESLVDFWYFHVPNLILAALMYTLLGRFLLSLVFEPDSDKVIWRVFVRVTAPVIRPIRYLTPALVPARIVVLLAFVWLLLLVSPCSYLSPCSASDRPWEGEASS